MLSYYTDNSLDERGLTAAPLSKHSNQHRFTPPATWFDRWWEPQAFLAEVKAHAEPVPQVLLFNNPELKQLRESLAAALFADLRSRQTALKVRIEADRFPDFWIRVQRTDEPFELVEADRAGRKRGKEYRKVAEREAAGLLPESQLFDPVEERLTAVEAIARVIEQKVAKRYRPAPNLLVYVNFFIFQKLNFSLSEIHRLMDLSRDQFPSTWLLWGKSVAQVWPRQFRIRDRRQDEED